MHHDALDVVAARSLVLVPLGLVAWVEWGRSRTRTARVLGVAATAAYIRAIALSGMWLVPPWYTPVVYLVLLLGAVGASRGPASAGRAGAPAASGSGWKRWDGEPPA